MLKIIKTLKKLIVETFLTIVQLLKLVYGHWSMATLSTTESYKKFECVRIRVVLNFEQGWIIIVCNYYLLLQLRIIINVWCYIDIIRDFVDSLYITLFVQHAKNIFIQTTVQTTHFYVYVESNTLCIDTKTLCNT